MLRRVALLATASAGTVGALSVGAARAARPLGARGGNAARMSTLAGFEATKIDGSSVALKTYVGKPTLVVNVASL